MIQFDVRVFNCS